MIRPVAWSVVLLTSVTACSNRQTSTAVMAPAVNQPVQTVQQVNYAEASPEVIELARSLDQTASSTALPDMSERHIGIDDFKRPLPFSASISVDGPPTPAPIIGDGPTRVMNPDGSLKRTRELHQQTTPGQNFSIGFQTTY